MYYKNGAMGKGDDHNVIYLGDKARNMNSYHLYYIKNVELVKENESLRNI